MKTPETHDFIGKDKIERQNSLARSLEERCEFELGRLTITILDVSSNARVGLRIAASPSLTVKENERLWDSLKDGKPALRETHRQLNLAWTNV